MGSESKQLFQEENIDVDQQRVQVNPKKLIAQEYAQGNCTEEEYLETIAELHRVTLVKKNHKGIYFKIFAIILQSFALLSLYLGTKNTELTLTALTLLTGIWSMQASVNYPIKSLNFSMMFLGGIIFLSTANISLFITYEPILMLGINLLALSYICVTIDTL